MTKKIIKSFRDIVLPHMAKELLRIDYEGMGQDDAKEFSEHFNEILDLATKALEQQPCEMTTEEYRQRMIQTFHNADTDELIAVCVLPTEKEFEHLEWLLKNHYKKAPCVDAISRQAVLDGLASIAKVKAKSDAQKSLMGRVMFFVEKLPSVTPQQKYGKWVFVDNAKEHAHCSECDYGNIDLFDGRPHNYCPNCGAKMQESEKV